MTRLSTFGAVAAFFSLLITSCGGSGGDDPKALCMQGCNKAKMCLPALAAQINCDQQCADPMYSGNGCKNQDEITAKAKSCLNMSCDQFVTCGMALPKCQPTGGSTSGADAGK